jgi:hypothetical protein
MTQLVVDRKPRPELEPVVAGLMAEWVLPFLMTVIGYRPIFDTLEPAVGPGGHISPGAHFFRTLMPFKDGYLDPGDGSYAEALRRAHANMGVPRSLIGHTLRWNLIIMVMVAMLAGRKDLVDSLKAAARVIAHDIRVSQDWPVVVPVELNDMFKDLVIIDPMRGAFWEVIGFAKIREIIGDLTDEEILETCRRYLPEAFVNQFTR